MVPIVFEVIFIALLTFLLSSQEKVLLDLATSSDAIIKLQKGVASCQRLFFTISTDTEFSDQSKAELTRIHDYLKHPSNLTEYLDQKTFPELAELVAQSREYNKVAVDALERVQEVGKDQNLSKAEHLALLKYKVSENKDRLLQMVFDGSSFMKRVLEIASRVRAARPEEMAKFHQQLAMLVGAGLLVSSAISISLARLFTKDILDRLRRISHNAHLLATERPLEPPQKGMDEFSQLDLALHEASRLNNDFRRKELAVLDNAADIVCSLDERLRFEGVSMAAIRVWKYNPDELLGMSLLSLLTSDTAEDTRLAFQQIAQGASIENKSVEGSLENVVRCKDKTLKDSSWSVRWSNEERKYFCVVNDVTELRAIERLKAYFISIVSHDLRTPLTSVKITLQLLADGEKGALTDPVQREISKCRSNLDRLTNLVNELLELEKLEAGKLTLNKDLLSASYICDQAKESLEAMAANAGVTIKGPRGDSAVLADEARLIQVMTNLLSNAIKFSPPGSTISILVSRIPGFVEIRVVDQGPGIAKEDCDLIFEKFKQTTTGASETRHKSSGLGLAIVREILEGHSGKCGVESEVGKGSAFWIRLPAVEEEDEQT